MKSVIISCLSTAFAMDASGVRGTVGLDSAESKTAEESPEPLRVVKEEYEAKEEEMFEMEAAPRRLVVGYPPEGIPEEYIKSSLFPHDLRASLLAKDPHRDAHAHGPQVIAGIGNEPYYNFQGWDDNGKNMINAEFDPTNMPIQAPFEWFRQPQAVTNRPYNNFMANIFKDSDEFHELWEQYSIMRTQAGKTFTEGAKTGVDNPDHPNIISCGFMFTDEFAPDTWQEFTDEMMFRRHNWHPVRDYFHSSDLAGQVPSLHVDPTVNGALMQGMFIKTSRIRTGRSIKGFPLPPSIDFEQRRALEQVVVKALSTLGVTDYAQGFHNTLKDLGMEGQRINLNGKYFPEFMSRSMATSTAEEFPNVEAEHFAAGMDLETNQRLLASGNAFQHPDSTLLLSTGCARHWPDARGVWENADSDLFVWVSEEDHMRIVSMERGGNFQKVWMRFISGIIAIEEAINSAGFDYILNERYGYILSCPSNTGAGIRAGSHIRMAYLPQWANGKLGIEGIGAEGYPKLSSTTEGGFKGFCEAHRLQGRGMGGVDDESGGAIVDLSNVDRIGYSEAQLVTFAIKGMAGFVRLEMRLHFYKEIERFQAAIATGDSGIKAAAFERMINYVVEDMDKDGTVVNSKGSDGNMYSGTYSHDLLDPEGSYIGEFINNVAVTDGPAIAKFVAEARIAGEEGNFDAANAALLNIKPMLLKQFLTLKEAGLLESASDIVNFKRIQKNLSDAKKIAKARSDEEMLEINRDEHRARLNPSNLLKALSFE